MSSPLVSILIPCFNSEKFIGEAIDSALSQSYPKKEIVVIDDGSNDNSLQIIKKYGSRILWETGPNRGACVARNRALYLSRGSLIQYLDADETLLPNKLTIQVDQLSSEEFDLSFSRAIIRHEERDFEEPSGYYPDPSVMDPLVYTIRYILGTNGPLQRREILERVGGFRPGIPKAQETEMYWRLGAARARLVKTDEPLVMKREHKGSRISNRISIGKDYILQLFVINVLEMHFRGQLDTAERRSFVATHLCELSDNAHRHGLRRSSAIGFELAEQISNVGAARLYYQDVRWKNFLALALGSPWRAAEVMRWGRHMRNSFLSVSREKQIRDVDSVIR